jgi:hypothetical protein
MSIPLGCIAKDTITGFKGVVTSRTEFLYGCVHIGITPDKLDENGKPVESQWFDEQRIEVIKAAKPKVSKDSEATSGGPSLYGHSPARRHG